MTKLAEGCVIAGRYRLTRLLSRGGMGHVWVARSLETGGEVAIKMMSPGLVESIEARARFEREAKASAMLQSPNVVQILDYGVDGALPFMVMELLQGESLEQCLARDGRLPAEVMLQILEPVCRALGHAHEMGLIHRDLKPENIFLARSGKRDEVVKILDFGIAKDTGLHLVDFSTQTGALMGSPHYMSPEQIRQSRGVDLRADLWSIAVIVFRCLTGELPFPGDTVGDVLLEVCTERIPVPSELAPDLDAAVDRFMERGLSRDREARFQSAGELYAALSAAV